MKTRLLIIFFVVGILSYVSIFGITNSEARCVEDPCYYYSPPRVIDASGNSLDSIMVGQQIQVTVDVANAKDHTQPFVALLHIVDENNFSVSLNWVSGVLDPDSSFSPGTSWIPEKSGYYTATVYIWESLERTVPLAPVRTTSIDVVSKNDLSGTQNNSMKCKDNLVLIQRYDGSSACVKPEIYAKLIIRGWASVPTYDEYMSHEIEIPDDVDASELQRIIKENESGLNAGPIKISSDSNIPEPPSELPVFKSDVVKKSVANVASLASSEFGIRGNVERFSEGYVIDDFSSGQVMFYDNGAFNYTSYKYDASAQLDFSQNYGKYRTHVFKIISDFVANLKDHELFPTHPDYNIERYWHHIDLKSFNDVNYIDIKHKQTFAGQEILGNVNDVTVSVDEGGNVISINGDWRNWVHHKNLTVNTTPQDAVNEIIDMRNFESDERFNDGKYVIHEIDFDVNVVYALEKNNDLEEYLVPYWDVSYRVITQNGGYAFNEQISVE